jgi:hypothetical protein
MEVYSLATLLLRKGRKSVLSMEPVPEVVAFLAIPRDRLTPTFP